MPTQDDSDQISGAVRRRLNELNRLLVEAEDMSHRLQEDVAGLRSRLTGWSIGEDSSELPWEDQLELLDGLKRRLRAALRARRATLDLESVVTAGSADLALRHVYEWLAPLRTSLAVAPVRLRDTPLEGLVFREPSDTAGSTPSYAFGRSYIQGIKPGEADHIWTAVRELLSLAGFEIAFEGTESSGSVIKDWILRRSKTAAKNLAQGSAAAVNDSYIRKPGAEATLALAQSTAQLLAAMGENEGVHQFDNVIIGQFRGADGKMRSFSRELGLEERRRLESSPELLSNPGALLARLGSKPGHEVYRVEEERRAIGPPPASTDAPAEPASDI